jgi:hypothetical protein
VTETVTIVGNEAIAASCTQQPAAIEIADTIPAAPPIAKPTVGRQAPAVRVATREVRRADLFRST